MPKNSKQPDLNQDKAVNELDNHLNVTASAGTGKTEVLTRRFIHVLNKRKANVSNILAITFTEKAAAEMKNRILRSIKDKIKSETNANSQSYWRKVIKDSRHANISTIHSFCSKIIREHSPELGIDPDFNIIDETELKYEIHKFIKNTILKWIDVNYNYNNSLDKVSKALLDQFTFTELKLFITELFFNRFKLEKNIVPLFKTLENKEKYLNHINCFIEKERESRLKQLSELNVFKELLNNTNWLSSHYECDEKREASFTKYLILMQEIILSLKEGKLHPNFIKLYSPYEIGKEMKKKDAKYWTEEEIININTLVNKNISILRWFLPKVLFEESKSELDEKTYSVIKNLLSIYQNLVSHINQFPGDNYIIYNWFNRSLLTYDDLQTIALELLSGQNNSSNNSYSFIIEEIRNKYKYIMVDESQDIDEVQKRIINSLINPKQNVPNLFIVGDSKQSIYKFRGANISEFNDLKNEITGKNTIPLVNNYRSNINLVNFANLIFSNLLPYQLENFEVCYSNKILAKRDNNKNDSHNLPFKTNIELLLHNENKEKEAQNIARKIQSLVMSNDKENKIQYKDIAILFRALTNLQIYEKALSDHNIPYQIVNSRGFYQLQEIIDCMNILKYLDNPHDDLSLCGILRSPLCGVKDQTLFWLTHYNEHPTYLSKGLFAFNNNQYLSQAEKDKLNNFINILKDIQNKKDRLKINELLKLSLNSTLYIPAILSQANGQQKIANINQFLTKIKTLESTKSWTLSEFINYIEMLIDNDQPEERGQASLEDCVTIMTIHKSKGAEFPIVIIPHIDRKTNYNQPNIFFHSTLGIGLKVYSPDKRCLDGNTLYNYLKNEDIRKEIAESKRIFYVAITRARDHLILSGKSDFNLLHTLYDSSTNWMDYLTNTIGDNLIKELSYPPNKDQERKNIIYYQDIPISITWNLEKINYNTLSNKDFTKSFNLNQSISYINHKLNHSLDNLSASSLIVYEKCNRKFYYKFIKQIAELQEVVYKDSNFKSHEIEDETEDKLPKNIPLNLVGNIVHKILEKFNKNYHDLTAIISNYLNSQKLSALTQKDSRKKIESHTINLLNNFIQSEIYNNIESSKTNFPEDIYNEFSFSFKIDNAKIHGSIDKIYRDTAGNLTLLDYKTNHFQNKKNFLKELDKKNSMYKLQMEVYILAASRLLNNIKNNKFYYLDINKDSDIFEITNNLTIQIENHLNQLIKEINEKLSSHDTKDQFKTQNKDSTYCHICGYWMCERKKST